MGGQLWHSAGQPSGEGKRRDPRKCTDPAPARRATHGTGARASARSYSTRPSAEGYCGHSHGSPASVCTDWLFGRELDFLFCFCYCRDPVGSYSVPAHYLPRVTQHLNRVDKGTEDLKWTTGNKPDGLRNLGELFEKAPSEKSYPEYHKLVDKVMDLATIREKVGAKCGARY